MQLSGNWRLAGRFFGAALHPSRGRMSSEVRLIALPGLEAAELVDAALAAHARTNGVASGADLAVRVHRDVEAAIIIERRAGAVEPGADAVVVAQQEVDA